MNEETEVVVFSDEVDITSTSCLGEHPKHRKFAQDILNKIFHEFPKCFDEGVLREDYCRMDTISDLARDLSTAQRRSRRNNQAVSTYETPHADNTFSEKSKEYQVPWLNDEGEECSVHSTLLTRAINSIAQRISSNDFSRQAKQFINAACRNEELTVASSYNLVEIQGSNYEKTVRLPLSWKRDVADLGTETILYYKKKRTVIASRRTERDDIWEVKLVMLCGAGTRDVVRTENVFVRRYSSEGDYRYSAAKSFSSLQQTFYRNITRDVSARVLGEG